MKLLTSPLKERVSKKKWFLALNVHNILNIYVIRSIFTKWTVTSSEQLTVSLFSIIQSILIFNWVIDSFWK